MKVELDSEDIRALLSGWSERETALVRAKSEARRETFSTVLKALPALMRAVIKELSR